jgi:hypothetical protein
LVSASGACSFVLASTLRDDLSVLFDLRPAQPARDMRRVTIGATLLAMTDQPPIIKLDVNASDAAAARTLIKGMLETDGTEYQIELPEDTDELGRLILALAHEAALLAIQVHHDHPEMSAVRIVDMLASSEPRRGLRVVGPDDNP